MQKKKNIKRNSSKYKDLDIISDEELSEYEDDPKIKSEYRDLYEKMVENDNEDLRNQSDLKELQIEEMIHERYQRLNYLTKKFKFKKEQSQKSQQKSSDNAKNTKNQVLNDYQKQRQIQKQKTEQLKFKQKLEDDEQEEGEINEKNNKRHRKSSEESDYSDTESNVSEDSQYSYNKKKPTKQVKKEDQQQNTTQSKKENAQSQLQQKWVLEYQELNKIRLSRTFLAKMLSHHFFFEQTVVGCFVRVVIPSKDKNKPQYAICQIAKVEEADEQYTVENKTTKQILLLKHADKQRPIKITHISDGAFTAIEFSTWQKNMENKNIPLPDQNFILKKQKEIQNAKNYEYKDEEIKLLVEKNTQKQIENAKEIFRRIKENNYQVDNIKIPDVIPLILYIEGKITDDESYQFNWELQDSKDIRGNKNVQDKQQQEEELNNKIENLRADLNILKQLDIFRKEDISKKKSVQDLTLQHSKNMLFNRVIVTNSSKQITNKQSEILPEFENINLLNKNNIDIIAFGPEFKNAKTANEQEQMIQQIIQNFQKYPVNELNNFMNNFQNHQLNEDIELF